ncbi:MAG TPA: heme-binding domain-containing protein [Chitinophaga sp.]|uniref:heme-binding domain-containing protein n=1 Tax=Chitinophaga sp. TaxID=1869181 RepID=UPI002B7818DD|nr:heme-binding domain-containing protein [Chitinophaga sp.]HVI45372.1 heme-binding domain-containing protein [Chitinophaga sp.]
MITNTHPRKKNLAWKLAAIPVAALVVIQCIQEPLESKAVTAEIQAPKEVMAIFERSCYDCHSNNQELPWYNKIAPVSWQVNKDITRAREVLNFSEWGHLSKKEQVGKFWGILNMVKSGKMPLPRYTRVHPGATVTPAEIETIKGYVLSITDRQPADSNTIKAATQAYDQWKEKKTTKNNPPVSPNGIVYSDEFKSWKVISMSTLYDKSMRVIYGNDIAVKAIREENFHPWPDGAIVVKAVWEQIENQYGEVRPGKFINAQFMVKDAARYQDTEGWGFAKFNGEALTPTGKTVNFATISCISCHRQLAKETGFLFNVPLKLNPAK